MLIALNKPCGVLCQFSDAQGRATLADYVSCPHVYPAGRLDRDSEGLVLLTDDGGLQHRISHPRHAWLKTYWVQVEKEPHEQVLQTLREGVLLKDGWARAVRAERLDKPEPDLWPRTPPVRFRKTVPTAWLQVSLKEGRNRQVRRMTAAIGHPCLRLIRMQIGRYGLEGLQPGQSRIITS